MIVFLGGIYNLFIPGRGGGWTGLWLILAKRTKHELTLYNRYSANLPQNLPSIG